MKRKSEMRTYEGGGEGGNVESKEQLRQKETERKEKERN